MLTILIEVEKLANSNAIVARVEPGSIGSDLGIMAGDRIMAINGQPVADILDYRYLAEDDILEIELQRQDGELWVLEIEKDYDDRLGLEFDQVIFDRIKPCVNQCLFCFVDQLPPGMRATLQVKDDDYRLSFLFGNFISLTNLRERDWDKILGMHLSPLYISVHSTDPDTREKMFGTRKARTIMRDLKRLASGNIQMHTQIVLCPGINDGGSLVRTVSDLAALWPGVQSIGIVPLGITSHRQGLPALEPVDSILASRLIEQTYQWQRQFRQQMGVGFVYLADEFYVKAGKNLPESMYYDDYPQIENGIGLVAAFLDELDEALAAIAVSTDAAEHVYTVCGLSALPMFEIARDKLARVGLGLNLIPVENRYFGSSITVTGLLTGKDIAAAMGNQYRNKMVLIPDVMLRDDKRTFLDEMTIGSLSELTGAMIRVIGTDALSLLEALTNIRNQQGAGGGN